MKKVKRLTAALLVFVLMMGTYVRAGEVYVRYNQERYEHYKVGNVEQEAYYDFGTWAIGDNVRIYASSFGNSTNYVSINHANYQSNNFKKETETTHGNNWAYVNYNPWGVDYLQPGSYAYSTGAVELDLNVTY